MPATSSPPATAHDRPAAAAPSPGAWFDGAATLLIVLTRDGAVQHANASACRYAGVSDLTGQVIWDCALAESPTMHDDWRAAVAAAAAGRAAGVESERRDASGALVAADFTVTLIDAGAALLVEGRDATVRRARERRRRELLGAASHELRTPLVGVRGALAMLEASQSGAGDPRARDLVRLARVNADRLMRCVTDLLDLEHIRSGVVPIEARPTSAGDIARAAADALAPLAASRQLRLTTRDARGGRVLADHDRAAQALITVASHALGAAAGPGALRIAVTRPATARVRIAVEDPGGVIPPEGRAALFRQIESSATAGAGEHDAADASDAPPSTDSTLAAAHFAPGAANDETGLGMAIARAIIERQGGTLGASADADRAAVCWVELPAAHDAAVPLVLLD